MMSSNLFPRTLAALVLIAPLVFIDNARGVALALTDVEVDLKIQSVSPGATVSFVGSGTKQIDLGPIPGAVTDNLSLLRIAGIFPANGAQVPMSVGHFLEFDAEAEVRTNVLLDGQATYIRIDHSGVLSFENTGSVDATITFDIEREHRLRTTLEDSLGEFAHAHKTFDLSAFMYNASGLEIGSFPHIVDFDQQVQQGAVNSGPSDHFTFNLQVPAGESGLITMQAMAFSEVALLPEPSAILLVTLGAASIAVGGRRGRLPGA